jgi:hypothetical protein
MKSISQTVSRISHDVPRWSPAPETTSADFGASEFATQVTELRTEIMGIGVLIPFAVIAWSSVLLRLIFTRGEVAWAPILVGMAIIVGCGLCLWLKRPNTYRLALWLCAASAVAISIFHSQVESNLVGLLWMAAACVIVTFLAGAPAGWLSAVGLVVHQSRFKG